MLEPASTTFVRRRESHPNLLIAEEGSALADDGEYYALVTHVPGPLGTSEVEGFTGDRTAVRLAAVQWFTEATYAKTLANKMRKSSGGNPPLLPSGA